MAKKYDDDCEAAREATYRSMCIASGALGGG
jgi:hypothetical protein